MLRRYNNYSRRRKSKGEYFPSSSRSFRYPTYYQRVGRTIQTSAGRLPESPDVILSRPALDRMYQTLLEYKYPIPRSPVTSPHLEYLSVPYEVVQETTQMTPAILKELCQSVFTNFVIGALTSVAVKLDDLSSAVVPPSFTYSYHVDGYTYHVNTDGFEASNYGEGQAQTSYRCEIINPPLVNNGSSPNYYLSQFCRNTYNTTFGIQQYGATDSHVPEGRDGIFFTTEDTDAYLELTFYSFADVLGPQYMFNIIAITQ